MANDGWPELFDQFFKLYLQHIPQPGKILIRYYGLYANTSGKHLNAARSQLGQPPKPTREETKEKFLSWRDYLKKITGAAQKSLCKKCKQPLDVFMTLPRVNIKVLLKAHLRKKLKPDLNHLYGECNVPP